MQALVPDLFYGEPRLSQLLPEVALESSLSEWESGTVSLLGQLVIGTPLVVVMNLV